MTSTDLSALSDDDLRSALDRARDRETAAHEAIRSYEDAAEREGGSPAERVKAYQPLQDELDAAEQELEAVEAELARRA